MGRREFSATDAFPAKWTRRDRVEALVGVSSITSCLVLTSTSTIKQSRTQSAYGFDYGPSS